MKFRVRQPDGLLTTVSLSSAVVAWSIIIGLAYISWAWLSAYGEYSYAQQHSSDQGGQANHINGRSPSSEPTGEQPANNPNDVTTKRSDNPPASQSMNILNVFFTGVIAMFAWQTWRVYQSIRDHTMEIERAYISLRHMQPGLTFPNTVDEEGKPQVTARVKVKNCGNTPCTAIHKFLNTYISNKPLPAAAPYDQTTVGHEAIHVSLVKNSSFTIYGKGSVEASDLRHVRMGTTKIYLLGYVDYIDKFGRRHRSGYCCVYDPADDAPNHNLTFVTQPGYNYDIEIDEHGNPKNQ